MTDAPANTESEGPRHTSFSCPECHVELRVPANLAGRRAKCPDCGETIRIPDRRSRTAAPPPVVGHWQPPEPPPEPIPAGYLDRLADVRAEPPPPPPRWTFFSHVFDFPWRRGQLARWILMSVGFTLAGFAAGVAWTLFSLGGQFAIVIVGFVCLPVFWLTFWSSGYAAACGVAIVRDTAAGNDQNIDWPDPNWRDWTLDLLFVAWHVLLAGSVGYGVVWLPLMAGADAPNWWLAAGTVVLLLPVLLLSAMEANQPLLPFSEKILATLITRCWVWGLFYVLAGAVVAVWLGVLALVAGTLGVFLALLFNGPLTATVVFVTSRLLGRLAWRISIGDD